MNVFQLKALRVPAYVLAAMLSVSCNNDINRDSLGDTEPDRTDQQVLPPDFALRMGSTALGITEGQGAVNVPVFIDRTEGFTRDIVLSVSVANEADNTFLTRQLTDDLITGDESSSNLQLALAIGPLPLVPHTRTLTITASDLRGGSVSQDLTLQVQPSSAPDVYLLIGQSNMVGISEDDAKRAGVGEPDAPANNILQLNVTFNDDTNFQTASDFTNAESLFNTGNPLTIAQDPLHAGLQSDGSKTGTRIGMGLSFAKRASQNTSVPIYLVPAAWSDTGFCRRETNILPGVGWNATPKSNPELSGTLLHDRAIARANIALEETGGVLRGILWHQGEADSDNLTCAQLYAANLIEMVQSLRSNINTDARGPAARGPDADIPFILGTMSVSEEQSPFSDSKLLVDEAHRNIAQLLAFANVVNNDDLVPAAFPCGGGSCIHFGASALREMGVRYYDQLRSTVE